MSEDTSVTEQSDVKPVTGTKRKKNIKLYKMEKAMDKICERVTKGQVESDKLFVELEEKRMKLDHEMMCMEQERRREEADRAERQKREDREFQLRVFSMLLILILFIPVNDIIFLLRTTVTIVPHNHNRLFIVRILLGTTMLTTGY